MGYSDESAKQALHKLKGHRVGYNEEDNPCEDRDLPFVSIGECHSVFNLYRDFNAIVY